MRQMRAQPEGKKTSKVNQRPLNREHILKLPRLSCCTLKKKKKNPPMLHKARICNSLCLKEPKTRLSSTSVLSAKVGAANQQRCCSTDVFPQWRLSPLTLHTQTLLRKPFIPTTRQPIGPALPVPSANLTSSGENKWSPPPVASTIPQQPTEAPDTQRPALY